MRCSALKWSLAALILLAAPEVLACPYCAGQDKDGIASLFVIGAMMLFPFLVVATVIPLVRRAGRRAAPFAPDAEIRGDAQ